MKRSFEERLIECAGENNFRAARQLLKNRRLVIAWRDAAGILHGRFRDGAAVVDTTVVTGEHPTSECDCRHDGDGGICEHAAALIMHSGRFNPALTPPPEEPASYYSGLRRESLPMLMARAGKAVSSLTLEAVSAFPHVPSKWENVVLAVKLRAANREYLGNLNNLRQLYFDKSLSVNLKFDELSLQEQQIVRFLATNGEAENSQVLLNSEQTAEFFHSLIGFPRFFRAGRALSVRGDRAEPVLLRSHGKIMPGIRVGGSVLPTVGAKVIAGRSGCWIGRDGEYFFVAATCEIGFLRNFFRSQPQNPPREPLRNFPFPEINIDDPEPRQLHPELCFDGGLTAPDEFRLEPGYVYNVDGTKSICRPRSGSLEPAERVFWKRDAEFERAFEQRLGLSGFEFDGTAAFLHGIEAIAIFLDRIVPEISAGHPETLLTNRFASLLGGNGRLPELRLFCRCLDILSDAFLIGCELSVAGELVPWKAAADAASGYSEYFTTPDGRIAAIRPGTAAFMRGLPGAIRGFDPEKCCFELPFFNAAYFTSLAAAVPGAVVPEVAAGAPVVPGTSAPPDFTFNGELRPYQREGVDFLRWMVDRNFNPLLADEMGLGKTVQLLALLAEKLRRGGQPALIVCPASLVTNWVREANRFVPELRVNAPEGAARAELAKNLGHYELVILSYTAARLAADTLRRIKFSFVILDEAQHIKNPGSGNARSCKIIPARHRIVLSGTPLENTPEDLWSVIDFLQPGMLGTLGAFRRRLATGNEEENRRNLGLQLAPFIKRRTKREVAADLPPRSELLLYCDFSPAQRELYEHILEEGRRELDRVTGDPGRGNTAIFTLLLRLRQICCHPALLPDQAGAGVPSAKEELLFELLHENIDSGHKMLLFSQFTSLLKLLIPALEAAEIPFEYLDGATRHRQQHVDHFNHTPEIPLFLLSLKAGGTGLNLTAADTVILYDPWWNPAAELQAADRTHRIGQTRPVSTLKLVMRDSVEERVLMLQERKRDLFRTVIEEPGAGGGLTLDELHFLLDKPR